MAYKEIIKNHNKEIKLIYMSMHKSLTMSEIVNKIEQQK